MGAAAPHPAGLSDLSEVEMPELSDGGLFDIDVDAADWNNGRDGTDMLQNVASECPTQTLDVAVGGYEPLHGIDAGTQMDPEICAGPPCGIPAQANLIAQKPTSESELQLLQWAARAAARAHRRAADLFVFGTAGAWSTHRSLSQVRGWMRQQYGYIVNRPAMGRFAEFLRLLFRNVWDSEFVTLALSDTVFLYVIGLALGATPSGVGGVVASLNYWGSFLLFYLLFIILSKLFVADRWVGRCLMTGLPAWLRPLSKLSLFIMTWSLLLPDGERGALSTYDSCHQLKLNTDAASSHVARRGVRHNDVS